MPDIDINTEGIVEHADRLETMHKSAFPSAVRESLNGLAFRMKGVKGRQGEVEKQAIKIFHRRYKGFIKRVTAVKKAEGFDIEKMGATVGFDRSKLRGGNKAAVDDLEQQEEGGKIEKRTMIPTRYARTGKQHTRPVRKKYRLSQINDLVDAKENKKGRNKQEKFLLSAIHAGEGGWVIGTYYNQSGNRYVHYIQSIKERRRGLKVNSIPVYSFSEGRKAKIQGTGFMKKASENTMKHVRTTFKDNARRQIERLKRQGRY